MFVIRTVKPIRPGGSGLIVPASGGGGGGDVDLGNGWTMKNHASAGSADTNSVTTPAIDTTGATLLILVVGWAADIAQATPTDSKGNTWVTTSRYSGGGGFANTTLW